MKTLIYIGNKSNAKGKSNVSAIDTLSLLLENSGFKVYSASSKKNILLRLLDMLFTCFKYRKKANFVLIDTYSTLNFYYAYFVSQLSRILGLKYIPILHGGNLPQRLKTSPKLSKAIFNNAFINVAPSIYMISAFKALGFINVVHIPNAIEIKQYPFKRRNYDTIKMLWVRSFSKIYNPFLAIQVLKTLKEQSIESELCMVGPDSDGSLEEAKMFAEELGVDVRFTGKLSKQDWISLSANYNVFINTSNFDNMPVSVIEAMALGLPVISTNVGGMPFLIEHGKRGILVEPNSVETLAQAVLNLFHSKHQANKTAIEARNFVEHFDWEFVKKQWFEVLK
ncbi:glycosyltransferase family 4 protein [Flavobacteriaceae bacterium SZ-1-7]|uniref:glycosyltransferase family 4 protein n=1 Tax=Tamlana sedimenti TaxID=3134126 RepID=UPI0031264C69